MTNEKLAFVHFNGTTIFCVTFFVLDGSEGNPSINILVVSGRHQDLSVFLCLFVCLLALFSRKCWK